MITSNLRLFLAIFLSLAIFFGLKYIFINPSLFTPNNILADITQKTEEIKTNISSIKLPSFSKIFTLKFDSNKNEPTEQPNNKNGGNSYFFPVIQPTSTNPTDPLKPPPTSIYRPPTVKPTSKQIQKPTKKPTKKPVLKPTTKPSAIPTQKPIPTIGQVRPGKNLEEVISIVSQMACVPKPMLYAIIRNESGTRYDSMSTETFILYNTYLWWKSDKITSKNQICDFTAFDQKTGLIPSDSKFAGEFCWIGDITDSMGPMSISSFVWNAYPSQLSNLLGQSTFDRRVILDAILGAALHLKNVSTYRGSDCNNWELKYVAKASCKYLSRCEYDQQTNYCVNTCNYYNQYSSNKLDCSQTMSVITNDCQFK